MSKKLPPRIEFSGGAPDFSRPVNSLMALAEMIGVSEYRLKQWRSDSSELKKGRPYSVGKCVLELIVLGKIDIDSIQNLGKEIHLALAFDVAIDAAEHHHEQAVLDSMLDDPSVVDLILNEQDPTRLREGLRMSGPFKPKSWNQLAERESVVIAVASTKTAALFFDRVWSMDRESPQDIGVRFHIFEEKICLGLLDSLILNVAEIKQADEQKLQEVAEKLKDLDTEIRISQMFESMILTPVKRATGRDVPVFSSTVDATRGVFAEGERLATLAILEDVPLIDEHKLSWEQVQELRADSESRLKLLRFLHWIEKDYANQPLSFIREGIELKLAEYEEASKKHGVERSLGRLSVMLDGSLWLAVATAWDEVLAGLVGISVMGGRAMVEHYKYKGSQRDLKSCNPAAYIHEVRSRTC